MSVSSRTFSLHPSSQIRVPNTASQPVEHALGMLRRDWRNVMGVDMQLASSEAVFAALDIRYATLADGLEDRPEAHGFRFVEDGGEIRSMEIIGVDDLGLVYGILEFSSRFLGIQPFWFWMDQTIKGQTILEIPVQAWDAPEPAVRFRGWFVNDEVCLIGWKEPYPPTREVWEPVFEALLRCGGNMVIPGTDLPRHGVHDEVAAEMGLWVSHHHAEPLGAQMFLRAYPGRQASYQQEPELFEALWWEAIEKQKDRPTLWVLSFRGQGDAPFWKHDPSFDTPEKRGAMISKVVHRQYDMVRSKVERPVCSVALYGEISELYKGGYIDLPEDVIKIWADNGYGKMVSRRHGLTNHRIPALPSPEDDGKHGVYYHVTFHDLQASNHLTMFPGPGSFIADELQQAFAAGADEYLLVNSGNIRQHVYPLDVVRQLWQAGLADAGQHMREFVDDYFDSGQEQLVSLLESYPDAALQYGPNPDDWAGDEFYHHPAREIIGHWLRGEGETMERRISWATGEMPFSEQVQWFGDIGQRGVESWGAWSAACELAIQSLHPDDRQRATDHVLFHGLIHRSGSAGLYHLSRAYQAYSQGKYPQAFVCASEAMWSYQEGLAALRDAEHGKWAGFYAADWLTNIANTVEHVDTLRRWLRMHGDNPDMFRWFKEFLLSETEKHIYLENTQRRVLSDDELATRLKTYFETEATALSGIGFAPA